MSFSADRSAGWCFRAIVLLGFALGQAPLEPAAQTQANSLATAGMPTIHAQSRLVVVDVVVTRHGRPIAGLSKTDSTILEDGKPQNIGIFEPHALTEGSSAQAPPPLPSHQYTNISTVTPSSINIVLFEVLNTPFIDQPYARQQMVQFLKTLPRNQPVALLVLTTRLRMIAGFGTSSDEMLAAAKKPLPHSSELLDTQEHRQEAHEEIAELRQGSRNQEFFDRMQAFLGETTSSRDIDRAKTTLDAFS